MDARPLLSVSPSAGAAERGFPLLPTDLRRLLALSADSVAPTTAEPAAASPAQSTASRRTASSASESSFAAQLASLGGLLGLATALRVDLARGLAADGAASDLAQRSAWFGANYVAPPPARGLARLVAEAAFLDTTNLILVVDGVVAVALGLAVGGNPSTDWMEGACVLVAVLAIALVTAVGDFQKERQFRALNAVNENELVRARRLTTATTSSSSSGSSETSRVRKWALVVGDVVQLEPGDVVPADGLAFHSRELHVDESTLTGEPELVHKGDALQLTDASTDVDALSVRLFSGTRVMEGYAQMLVLCVGEHSQYGQITALIQGSQDEPQSVVDGHGREDATTDAAEADYHSLETPSAAKKQQKLEKKQQKPARPERTPLALKIEALNLWLGKMGVVVALAVLIVLAVRFSVETFAQDPREPWQASYLRDYLSYFILATTILVVAIPEGLPLAVAIALALAVRRMLRDRSLVRHLAACETVGNATTLCADKTGTLTANRMSVARLWMAQNDAEHEDKLEDMDSAASACAAMAETTKRLLCDGVALNSTAELLPSEDDTEPRQALGSQTEGALLSFVEDCGEDYKHLRQNTPVSRVLPFSSERKRMSVVVAQSEASTDAKSATHWRVYTKGAPELVLAHCVSLQTRDGTVKPLTSTRRAWLETHVLAPYARRGYRTLCLAYRDVSDDAVDVANATPEALERQLVCLALVAIADPLRPDTHEAVTTCQRAGIVVRMVTGDSLLTATAIARDCGILPSAEASAVDNESHMVMEGPAFRALVLDANGQLQQEVFDRVWPTLRVLARSSPQDKHTLVRGLRASRLPHQPRQLVAVTGDGTNDAPALRAAHVGFAMGRSGTSVAKEAADIVLMDDALSGVVRAVISGRGVFDGISQFLQFQLTVIAVALGVACVGAVTLRQSPIAAVQILWVNLFMDVFASLALTTDEPRASDLLARQPYVHSRPLVSPRMAKHVAGQTTLQLTLLLLLTFLGDGWFHVPSGRASVGAADADDAEPTQHLTIVFNTFVWLQLFNQLNCRQGETDRVLLDLAALWRNKLCLAALAAQCGLQVAIVQLGGQLFHVAPLSAAHWGVCIAMGALALPVGALLRLLKLETLVPKLWSVYCRRHRHSQESPESLA